MTVRLSIIVPTSGRWTLDRTLASIEPQLEPGDEIVVVHDYEVTPTEGRGNAERTEGLRRAVGTTHVAFMDDDDAYLPSALNVMREAACDRPVVFRMDGTRMGVGTLWHDRQLRYCNVSTQMFLIPNRPADMGVWEPHEPSGAGGQPAGSDYTFLKGCCDRMGDPVWREEIIAVLRPRTTAAVVTPWMNHPELHEDYMAAIRDADPHDLIIVDNGSNPPIMDAAIRFDDNQGFSAACNAGLERARSEAVVFLNNDIALTRSGWLDAILDQLEPGVLVGANLRRDRHGDVDGTPLPYLDGWCLAGMRQDLLDLGGFDQSYEEPAYYSDNDLCLRARAEGMVLREARVGLMHKLGATAGPPNAPGKRAVTERNYWRYVERARELLGAAAA